MKMDYSNAIKVLIDTFVEMKEIYDDNIEEYIDLPYAFYESEFVPFIVTQLEKNNLSTLNEIFDFIEKLFLEGDEMVINLVGVAVVESLYFEKDYGKYKSIILSLCGDETRKSFEECSTM